MSEQKKDCTFCGDADMLIFPLRYAVMYSGQLMHMPLLSDAATLGAKVSDIALTTKFTTYTTCVLRRGFLYVLLQYEGKPTKLWQAYVVMKDAKLSSFKADEPPSELPTSFSCDPYECGVNASMIKIKDAKKALKAWMLFTPNPLTKAMLGKIKANPDSFAAMQAFSPAEWLKGNTTQPHSLQAEQLAKHVAEMQDSAPSIRDALYGSLFPPFIDAFGDQPIGLKRTETFREHAKFLKHLQSKLQEQKFPTFVLYDAIGITQELNVWRNKGIEDFYGWLAIKEGKGNLTNDHRLHVLDQIDGLKNFMMDGVKLDQKIVEACDVEAANHSRALYAQGRTPTPEGMAEFRELFYEKQLQKKWYELTDGYLDQEYVKKFRSSVDQINARCKKTIDDNHADHLAWLKSQQLSDALAVYDNTMAEDGGNSDDNEMAALSGAAFQDQIGMAVVGMTNTQQGQALADEWIREFSFKDDGKNYLMRAYCYNQKATMKALRAALDDAVKQAPGLDHIEEFSKWYNTQYGVAAAKNNQEADDTAQQTAAQASAGAQPTAAASSAVGKTKDLVKGFDRIIKALSESSNAWWFSHKFDGKAAAVLGMFGERAFAGLTSDKRLARAMLGVLAAPLGSLAIKNYNVAFPGASADVRQARQMRTGANYAMKNWTAVNWAEASNAQGGSYLRIQVGSVLLILEAANLFLRASRENEGSRMYLELLASCFAVTAAGAELVSYGFRAVQRIKVGDPKEIRKLSRFAPALPDSVHANTVKSAQIAYGGIKVFAGSFALFAGMVGAGLDVEKAKGHFDRAWVEEDGEFNWTLTGLYGARAVGQGYLSILGAKIALSESAAFWGYMATTVKGTRAKAFCTWFQGKAVMWNTQRPMMYVKAARIGLFFIALGGVIYIVELANPGELQKYFLASCFRAEGTMKAKVRNLLFASPLYYITPEGETTALEAAFKEAFNIKEEAEPPATASRAAG